ncbi:MAG: DUF3379 family protein [Proteobacteria bacterium]|nr:DUF3379 family protein [Pseudomonadota bacterium]
MNCLEFRKQFGADPACQDQQLLAHRQACPACARFAARVQDFDRRLVLALRVPFIADHGVDRGGSYPVPAQGREWIGLAASLVLGLGVGLLSWWSAPHGDIAQDLLAHLRHEQISLVSTDERVPYQRLEAVLRRSRMTMPDGVARVSYARSCIFRGRLVPHLVVQGEKGPVTVMILPDLEVAGPTSFSEQGFFGTILPAAVGSIAIIGGEERDLEEVSEPIVQSLRWDI